MKELGRNRERGRITNAALLVLGEVLIVKNLFTFVLLTLTEQLIRTSSVPQRVSNITGGYAV